MKNWVLTGTVFALISTPPSQAESKDFVERAAKEVIRICDSKEGRDLGNVLHGICIMNQAQLFKDCWEKYPLDYDARSQKCTNPIATRAEKLRWEIRYEEIEHVAEIKATKKIIRSDEERFFDDDAMVKGQKILVDGKFRQIPTTKEAADETRRAVCFTSRKIWT